jgi:hypothetical protein
MIFGLKPEVEAAGIEPASADAPERASTSLSCAWNSPGGRRQATYRRASHPLKSRSGRLALPRRRARCWRRIPSHGPKTERRRYLTRLGGECEIVLRTCVCPGCFTRPTGDLGLQLFRRTDHVETRSPPRCLNYSRRSLSARSTCRCASRSARSRRLSRASLPRASAISTFTRPFLK